MTDANGGAGGDTPRPRSALTLAILAVLAMAGVVLFLGLGIWQVQRLHWKLDLIARVEARLAADPVAAPGPQDWAGLDAKRDEYRRVTVSGTYLLNNETLVKAVTERGDGFWVMTPMATDAGWTVLVNRGFVPGDRREAAYRQMPEGPQVAAGLLRLSQPDGAFLRANRPEEGRWYSRDTAAIAETQSLGTVAPYFIDAAAGPDAAALPVGGLTVVSFRNHHLQYALTWFAMAAGLAGASLYLGRQEWRNRRAAQD